MIAWLLASAFLGAHGSQWLKGEYTIAEVANQLQVQDDFKIQVPSGLADRVISVRIPLEPREEVLNNLVEQLGLRLEWREKESQRTAHISLQKNEMDPVMVELNRELDRLKFDIREVWQATPELQKMKSKELSELTEIEAKRRPIDPVVLAQKSWKTEVSRRLLETPAGRTVASMIDGEAGRVIRETYAKASSPPASLWIPDSSNPGKGILAVPVLKLTSLAGSLWIFDVHGSEAVEAATLSLPFGISAAAKNTVVEAYKNFELKGLDQKFSYRSVGAEIWPEVAEKLELKLAYWAPPEGSSFRAMPEKCTLGDLVKNAAGPHLTLDVSSGWLKISDRPAPTSKIPWTRLLPLIRKVEASRDAEALLAYGKAISVADAQSLTAASSQYRRGNQLRILLTTMAPLVKIASDLVKLPETPSEGETELLNVQMDSLRSSHRNLVAGFFRSPDWLLKAPQAYTEAGLNAMLKAYYLRVTLLSTSKDHRLRISVGPRDRGAWPTDTYETE